MGWGSRIIQWKGGNNGNMSMGPAIQDNSLCICIQWGRSRRYIFNTFTCTAGEWGLGSLYTYIVH